MPAPTPGSTPSSILIIGSGVFGLSTALALAQRPEYTHTTITLVDKSPFPAPDGSSVDSSRIIRADYADASYAALAAEAVTAWRDTALGAENRYHPSGLAICLASATESTAPNSDGGDYMTKSLDNVTRKLGLKVGSSRAEGAQVQILPSKDAVKSIFQPGFDAPEGWQGYVNWTSGWAHATNGLRWTREQVEQTGRVTFREAAIKSLLFHPSASPRTVIGAETSSGEHILADLTIVAAGAWSGILLDLRGIASASGQALAYMSLTPEEQTILAQNPVIISETSGMFIIPPTDGELKIARHGYGYINPQPTPHPENPTLPEIKISIPTSPPTLPAEAQTACRTFLAQTFPALAQRPFTHTRVCWYMDSRSGDWLIDYHPQMAGVFVATAGSGHAYKFLPVVGERIVDVLLGKERDDLGRELRAKWKWPERRGEEDHVWTKDWRGGRMGMVLEEELRRGREGEKV